MPARSYPCLSKQIISIKSLEAHSNVFIAPDILNSNEPSINLIARDDHI